MDEDVLWKHQSTLIIKLFGIFDVNDFIWRKNNDQWVPTWDNKIRVRMSKEQIISIHKESCILGPLAALFGRELQQFLMQNPKATLIKQQDMQYSIDSGQPTRSGAQEMKMPQVQREHALRDEIGIVATKMLNKINTATATKYL